MLLRSYCQGVSVSYSNGWDLDPKDGLAYRTRLGAAYQNTAEDFLASNSARRLHKKVNLILTSPPFPLLSPKRYGNTQGEEYITWLVDVFRQALPLLTDDGSLVVEIGNAWNKGEPTMSLVPLRALMAIQEELSLNLCQQFICNNTGRLPGPATWVTKRRIRVKDSFTHVWWMAPSSEPKADNRGVLQPYSEAMKRLIERRSYNAGRRPSDHVIKEGTFLTDNGGAIPSSVFNLANTSTQKSYSQWCRDLGIRAHPARMQRRLVEFFVKFLTEEGDRVYDPFGGSNTTGLVAEDLGRRWVMSEPDSDYLLGSVGRFV